MTQSNVQLIQQYNAAFKSGNFELVRSMMDDQFTFKGPMMSFYDPDSFVSHLQACGITCEHKNPELVIENNNVVQIFDWCVTSPFEAEVPMSELIRIENGKIKHIRLFYDSAAFPDSAVRHFEEMAKKSAA